MLYTPVVLHLSSSRPWLYSSPSADSRTIVQYSKVLYCSHTPYGTLGLTRQLEPVLQTPSPLFWSHILSSELGQSLSRITERSSLGYRASSYRTVLEYSFHRSAAIGSIYLIRSMAKSSDYRLSCQKINVTSAKSKTKLCLCDAGAMLLSPVPVRPIDL